MTKKVLSSLMALCIFGYSVVLPGVVIFNPGTASSEKPTAAGVGKPVKAKTRVAVQPPQSLKTVAAKPVAETSQTALSTAAAVSEVKQTTTATPATATAASGARTSSKTESPKTVLSAKEYEMLVRIISAESKGEPLQGQVAVGAVILNRMKSSKFPKTVTANVLKRGEFEPVSNGQIWNEPVASAYRAAQLALKGWDPTYGALYFYNPAKTSSRWIWSRPTIVRIGDHVFAG